MIFPVGTQVRWNSVTENGKGLAGNWHYGRVVEIVRGTMKVEIERSDKSSYAEYTPGATVFLTNGILVERIETVDYLNKMTVKELREVAERMTLTIPSKAKKSEIIAKLREYIDGWHVIALDMNRALHVDSPIVIDTEEFPMDHAQFTSWFNRRGGIESFDGIIAIDEDHAEALAMDKANAPVAVKAVSRMKTKSRIFVYAAQVGGLNNITPRQFRRITKKVNADLKRRGLFAKYPHLMTPSGKRKAAKNAA